MIRSSVELQQTGSLTIRVDKWENSGQSTAENKEKASLEDGSVKKHRTEDIGKLNSIVTKRDNYFPDNCDRTMLNVPRNFQSRTTEKEKG